MSSSLLVGSTTGVVVPASTVGFSVISPPLVIKPIRKGVCPEQTSTLPAPIVVRKYLPQILIDPAALAPKAMAAELTALGMMTKSSSQF